MQGLQPLKTAAPGNFNGIRYILTDIDDTLTLFGKLPASAYSALWRLATAGYHVIPVTGRPAGWCDLIARQWPVAGVVGENGALYFRYDEERKIMKRRYWKTEEERSADRIRLETIRQEVLHTVPGCAVSADQVYREADLAIDFCEDVPALSGQAVQAIVDCFARHGAIAKVSSIHVNGWYGDYDKLAMSRRFFADIYAVDIDANRHQVLYVGDSPNDAPMFGYFPHSVGVANVLHFSEQLEHQPAWVTEKEGGDGFAELVDVLLATGAMTRQDLPIKHYGHFFT
ncbi:MAG: HAD-IIB family hydrolase [Pseudomonadota bacterium]